MTGEGHFQTHDGQRLFELRWEPDTSVRGAVVLIHGYGDHCARYTPVAGALNDIGVAVHAYDQRGFGRSPGERARIDDFDAMLRDLDCFLEHIRPRTEGKPLFLLGQSFGGLVIAAYMQSRKAPVNGLIFCNPFLALPADVPAWLLALGQVLGRIAPWVPVTRVDNSGLARDPEVVRQAENDPLGYHGPVRARTGALFQTLTARVRADFASITAPLYIIHGTADRVVPAEGSKALYENCDSQDKTLKLYEGGYHEMWHDVDKEAVLAGIRDWVAARL